MTQVIHGLTRDELVKRVYGDDPVIDWNKATSKEIAAAGRKVVESWRNPGGNQKQRGE